MCSATAGYFAGRLKCVNNFIWRIQSCTLNSRRCLATIRSSLKESTQRWESVVGLEIHAQISSKSKLFSESGTSFFGSVNAQVSHFDASLPGTLPVLNRKCVEAAVLTALALNCRVNRISTFDRKHYFYADLPTGYQITQQTNPIARDGICNFIVFNSPTPYKISSRVLQLQLEQDSGKSLHDDVQNRSLIDLNRAGIALMEIVFDCDLKNGEEAAALVEELRMMMMCLGTCNGKMEEGSLRVDANVSINKPGEAKGVRTEIKNISSLRAIAQAIDFEIQRQIQRRENGEVITNETRMFDNKLRETVSMRDKEVQQDYRFMPEPNLPPLILEDIGENLPGAVSVARLSAEMPELPQQKRERIMEKYGFNLTTAQILLREEGLLKYFENIVSSGLNRKPKQVVNILLQDLYSILNKRNLTLATCNLRSALVGELLDLYINDIITDKIKVEVLSLMISGDTRTPTEIVDVNNWRRISDVIQLRNVCEEVLKENQKLVTEYRSGKIKVLNTLQGIVRKKTNNKANMSATAQILKELMSKT